MDVAPRKGAHIFNGDVHVRAANAVKHKPAALLEQYIAELPADVLIAWDAPLTSCTDPDGPLVHKDLTQRVIEAFFSRSG
jgi:hypothetical protein